jgi:RNA polymerase sigma-70 factor, ECF subfamily
MREASVTAGYGGRETLERVYDRYGNSLISYARALLGSAEDAEDAVQEVFVRLAKRADRIDSIRELRKYLLRSTRNAAYELLRGRMRRERLEEGIVQSLSEYSTETAAPEVAAILQGFDQLPPDQREVLALKVFQGLTFREIGEVIGKSQNTAASRYRYAIERLRQAAGSDEDGQ